jgi:hypothetical protein
MDETTMSTDCLQLMVSELRQARPPVQDADAFGNWEAAMGQAIAALGTQEMRWAATVLVANDLVLAMPGLVLSVAFQRVAETVLRQTVGAR